MRFASLGSGSRGNATLIEAGDTRLLVDCGFSAKELTQRLKQLSVEPDSLQAILVTHEHGDHSRGVGALARRYGLPIWATGGTLRQGRFGELPQFHVLNSHQTPFRIGQIQIKPFPVPHDARETVQFSFEYGDGKLGMLTDSGAITPHIIDQLQDCNALILECNHDRRMLANGPYPPRLQARVGGNYGHLSNCQAASFLQHIDHSRLRHLVAAHLSEKNNTPELAKEALLKVSRDLEGRMTICRQDQGTPWLEM